MNPDRIFAYLKAELPDGPANVELSGDDDLLIMPFVGRLFATLVYDTGDSFTYLQKRHLDELVMNTEEVFDLGVRNLEGLLSSGLVRVHQHGAGYPIIGGGNFEASLLLVDSVWEWMCGHIGAARLLALAPARDLLMVASADDPAGLAELVAFRDRIANASLDHVLCDDLYLWDGKAWSVAESSPRSWTRT